jgi:putative PIN family toxin of toxin-antitoxin system
MSENKDIKPNRIRIVIDTSVWISFFFGKVLKNLSNYLENDNFILLFSNELLDELIEVLSRPKFRKHISEEDIMEIIGIINYKAEWITIKEKTDICRDKKDNFLLDLALNGKAHYLVTGDDDLLVIKEFGSTKIVNYKEFDKKLSVYLNSNH